MKTIALIVAAGRGARFGGDIPKQFRTVQGRPLLAWTIQAFETAASIDEIVLVVQEEFLLYTSERVVNPFAFNKIKKITIGGETRAESVGKGLKALPISTSHVAIHDGARPLIWDRDIDRVVAAAHKDRAAILARPVAETVKRVEGDFVLSTLDRRRLFTAETPQVFQYDLIISAHAQADPGNEITDDSLLIEQLGFKVRTVIPEKINLKVTTEDDLLLVKFLMEAGYGSGH